MLQKMYAMLRISSYIPKVVVLKDGTISVLMGHAYGEIDGVIDDLANDVSSRCHSHG
jgi:hypothetical protein